MEKATKFNIQEYNFCQFPKWLFDLDISNNAKMLYVYLYDLYRISNNNPKYKDENNNAFVICTRENMQKVLNCSKGTVIKIVKELLKHNLVDEKKILSKANKIYLKTPSTNNNFCQCPKWLFDINVSNDAKVLYVKLYDYFRIAINNPNYCDKQNNIFVVFTRDKMQKLLKCSKIKAIKVAKELLKNNLIEEKSSFYQANRIYVNIPSIDEEKISTIFKVDSSDNSCKSNTYSSSNIKPIDEVQKVNPNNNYKNKTISKINNIDDIMTKNQTSKNQFIEISENIVECNKSYICFNDSIFEDLIDNPVVMQSLNDFNDYHKNIKHKNLFKFKDIAFYWVRMANMYKNSDLIKRVEQKVIEVLRSFSNVEDRLKISLLSKEDLLNVFDVALKYYDPTENTNIRNINAYLATTVRSKFSY